MSVGTESVAGEEAEGSTKERFSSSCGFVEGRGEVGSKSPGVTSMFVEEEAVGLEGPGIAALFVEMLV